MNPATCMLLDPCRASLPDFPSFILSLFWSWTLVQVFVLAGFKLAGNDKYRPRSRREIPCGLEASHYNNVAAYSNYPEIHPRYNPKHIQCQPECLESYYQKPVSEPRQAQSLLMNYWLHGTPRYSCTTDIKIVWTDPKHLCVCHHLIPGAR